MSAITKKRIIVGIDDSDGAREALNWAAREAACWSASLEVVHAYLPGLHFVPSPGMVGDPYQADKAAKELLEHDVPGAVGAAGLAPADVATLAIEGTAARVLRQAAAGADLLVVGSRGHGGFTGLLLGSVSQACVQHPPCPVVIIPHHRAS